MKCFTCPHFMLLYRYTKYNVLNEGDDSMKLERLSENQIRCTLNREDLADRELLLNELAYGTDKAKELFRDMMEQAAEELDFEVNDIPLMIEAIPVSPDCLILIITKVDDPDEFDNHFSRFSKYADIEIEDTDEEDTDDSDEQAEAELSAFPDPTALMESITDVLENIEQVKKQTESGKGPAFIPLSAALRESAAKKAKEKNSKKKVLQSLTGYSHFETSMKSAR